MIFCSLEHKVFEEVRNAVVFIIFVERAGFDLGVNSDYFALRDFFYDNSVSVVQFKQLWLCCEGVQTK